VTRVCTCEQAIGQVTTARQLLTAVDAADAAALDASRCQQPVSAANARYCEALFRTLDRCRHRFGRFTLRCSHTGATACSTGLAQIQGGRCGARQNLPRLVTLRSVA